VKNVILQSDWLLACLQASAPFSVQINLRARLGILRRRCVHWEVRAEKLPRFFQCV